MSKENRKLEENMKFMHHLNDRQQAMISHALRHPEQQYTIHSHRISNQIANRTARTDLFGLVDLQLFEKIKRGKKWVFQPKKTTRKPPAHPLKPTVKQLLKTAILTVKDVLTRSTRRRRAYCIFKGTSTLDEYGIVLYVHRTKTKALKERHYSSPG